MVYKDLCKLSKCLDASNISEIQERLNEIENKFKVDGKFTVHGAEVKGGQAIITALIERCYRLAHHLIVQAPEVDPVLVNLKTRVERLISDLRFMSTSTSAWLKIYSQDLIRIQEELDEIDSHEKDSKFLDSFGNIPSGQAHLRDLIERAYDLINDCQLVLENEDDDQSFISLLKDSIQQIEDRLFESSNSVFTLSKGKLRELNNQFSSTVGYVKEWLKDPKKGLNEISSKVASVHRSGMSVLSKIYAELEPVSEELLPLQSQLNVIRSSLLEIRNHLNKAAFKSREQKMADIKELKERVDSLYSELEAIDKNRVDGNFLANSTIVKDGQDHLRSLFGECMCLVFELIDRFSVVDF